MNAVLKPSPYAGLECFDYSPKGTELKLTCWLDYTEAERGSRERGTGLQIEPDYPADATLCLAEINGQDIAECLNQATIDEIESAFLEQ